MEKFLKKQHQAKYAPATVEPDFDQSSKMKEDEETSAKDREGRFPVLTQAM